MTQKKSNTLVASAVSLALSSMMLSASVNAGVIDNLNNAPTVLGACGGDTSDLEACVGAWNLDNVTVQLVKVDSDPVVIFGTFDPVTGFYSTMGVGDTFRSLISDGDNAGSITGILGGKDWPVGEPTGIKAVNNDPGIAKKNDGSPGSCLINTAYLGKLQSNSGVDAYLDITNSEPVVCSSGFQSHKRWKVAMQPAAVDAADSDAIDLVFNVAAGATINPYQVFSKINNYTGKRLAGFKIQVGRGKGAQFQTASELGLASQLYLSLGIGEETKANSPTFDLFDTTDGLANFSHGLFGPVEDNFTVPGFFSDARAYYPVEQRCETAAGVVAPACLDTVVVPDGTNLPASDTIYTSGVLSANYTGLFGPWLPSIWAPKGLFTPDPVDPEADPILQAWWNGTNWIKYDVNNNYAQVILTAADIQALVDKGATLDVIEDVLNLGPNYIVKVGDITNTNVFPNGGADFTIRIIPVESVDQSVPLWVSSQPPALPAPTPAPAPTTTSDGGGGCTIGGNGHVDPTLPALLAAGLGFFGWRRFKNGK